MKRKVGVVGAGAAGLASARELLMAGYEVTVFEQSGEVGGVWVYTSQTDDDLSGSQAGRTVFSSLYQSLRTNLPRDLMAFDDYTFDDQGGGKSAWPRYPHHEQVLRYLQNFAFDKKLQDNIRFNEQVLDLAPRQDGWLLTTTHGEHKFDAVVVASGHYAKPRLPDIPGLPSFSGATVHAHNYREPGPYRGQQVLVVGTAASGADISREVATLAKEVVWCGPAFDRKIRLGSNLWGCQMPIRVESKRVIFDSVPAGVFDSVIFCTGYSYDFPFLDKDIVLVKDNYVSPLYLDMLPVAHPTLAFIGLPFLIVPFPLFQIQARWFAATLNGHVELPDERQRRAWLARHEASLDQQGVLTRHRHKLGERQTPYLDFLLGECGAPSVPDWFQSLAAEAQAARLAHPRDFRDRPLKQHGPSEIE